MAAAMWVSPESLEALEAALFVRPARQEARRPRRLDPDVHFVLRDGERLSLRQLADRASAGARGGVVFSVAIRTRGER
jgi:hypothetical protein